MGLLQVVSQDLLVLDGSVTILVDAVCPGDKSFVQGGARALEKPLVGGVADQDMSKSIAPLGDELGGFRPHELNAHERLVLLGNAFSDVIGEEHLMLADVPVKAAVTVPTVSPKRRTLRDAMSRHILQVLDEVGGNKRRAARELGVSRATLDRKLREIAKPASR